MNNEISEEQTSRRHTPEERALILRLRLYVQARWLVIIGVIGATLIATLVFQIGFPTLPVYIICTVIALYNLLLYYWTQRLKAEATGFVIKKAETYGNIQIFLDLLTLTVLIHYTGGIENPLVFFYLAHTITAGIVLPKRRAYEIATLAMLMVTLLVFLEYANVIPHVNLDGFVLPYRYEQLSRVLAVLVTLTALVYGCTYLVTAISRELRHRQQETVKLKDQLIEKRTMELEQISGEVAKLEDERRRFVQFLGVVAHDLQSPLVATQSIMSYILDGYTGEITDGQRDLLERGVRRIDGLLTLITDLLDIPRIEGGQVTREMREISLNEVVKSAVDGLDKMALQKGITLKIELSESLSKIHGVGRRLQQVVTNLVSNAINYSHEGTVLVRVTDNTSDVRIEVIDSGIGIPPEDLPQLFKDFVRGSNVGIKGTGLGLSISKRIVEAHGGRIWAESPDPQTHAGSRFTFTLPKKQMAVHEEKQE